MCPRGHMRRRLEQGTPATVVSRPKIGTANGTGAHVPLCSSGKGSYLETRRVDRGGALEIGALYMYSEILQHPEDFAGRGVDVCA